MHHPRGTKVSSLALNDTQTTCARKRMSHVGIPLSSMKSRMNTIGKKKLVKGNKRDEQERKLLTTSGSMRRKSYDINLPRRDSQAETVAREFPDNWQTSLGPARSCLRSNHSQDSSIDEDHTSRPRSSLIWPTSLAAHSKFFRLIVVASPSLQRLSHRV